MGLIVENLYYVQFLLLFTCRQSWWFALVFFLFGRSGWLIRLRFVFGVWGESLGASVRASVRVRVACSGRFYLECTVGGPVVYMGRGAKMGRQRAYGARIS